MQCYYESFEKQVNNYSLQKSLLMNKQKEKMNHVFFHFLLFYIFFYNTDCLLFVFDGSLDQIPNGKEET